MSALKTAAAFATAIVLVLLTTGAAGAGARPGTETGAALVKTGWWWVGNDTPLDETVVAPPQPSPPNVPKGALPVAAAGGEPEKLSALELRLDAGPGSFADRAALVLRENTAPGATVNAENATVLACPVTEAFWADGAAAAWKARPSYDCDLASAQGERDAKTGLWTFDLTAVAALWTADGHRGSTAVALVEGVDAPVGFQVSFDGAAAKGIGLDFAFSQASDDAPAAPAPQGAAAGAAPSGRSPGASTSNISSAVSGPPAEPAMVAPAQAGDPVVAEAAQELAVNPAAAPMAMPPWYAGIPAAGYALLPLMLGLAYLLMLVLGPDAQPAAGPTQRGVGRALEKLRTVRAAGAPRGRS